MFAESLVIEKVTCAGVPGVLQVTVWVEVVVDPVVGGITGTDGVTLFDGTDAELVQAEFVAVTVNVQLEPFVSHVTIIGEAVPTAV